MTTLHDRAGTALLVVDMQVGVVAQAHGRDAVVANVRQLIDLARTERTPIVWVQHEDEGLPKESDEWALIPELLPLPGEPVVEKRYGDAFEDTCLESVLCGMSVGRLIVAGAQTDACIRSTLHGALVRGYDTLLVADAHTTEDLTQWGAPAPEQVITHTNLYWSNQTAPGRQAGTLGTSDVRFSTAD